MAEQHIHSQLSSVRGVITPISARDTFAAELCGLPCTIRGCRRHDLSKKIRDSNDCIDRYLDAPAVEPILEASTKDCLNERIGSWLLVTGRANEPDLHVLWATTESFRGVWEREGRVISSVLEQQLSSEDKSIALFGLSCPVQPRGPGGDFEVHYCEFWIKLSGTWGEVTKWDACGEHDPPAVVGSLEWESLALILGELVWNFVAHAVDTGDGTGAFWGEVNGHDFVCRLVQHGFRQPYPEESVTFEYLGDILRMSGCGEAKYWVEDSELIWKITIDLSELRKKVEE